MGYLSCNAESAIATCDPYNWDRKKKQKQKPRIKPTKNPFKIREFSYSELESATNGFSSDNFLGKGSHGTVYRAVLDDGKLIAAVKRTTISKNQEQYNRTTSCTNCITTPAENEIEILSRVRNPNLVNLIGFSSDSKDQKKLIAVEFMPNGSLYDLLHSNPRPPGWTRRTKFALDVAKAVGSLHSSDPPVIHRDIKSSNVLLDHDGHARLGDFGLALRGHVEDVRIRCTPPAGTLGYLDPGYLAPGDLSTKSDVFSFGILLLEIITGRNAIDMNYSPPSVVDWAVPLIKHGEFVTLCDPRIGPPEDPWVIRQLVVLAARCVRTAAGKRPAMTEVVECLRDINKRVRAPVWNSLNRRVRRVRKSPPLIRSSSDAFENINEEDMIKTRRLGSRRNRKVSSVPGFDSNSGLSKRVGRSKSIGSFSEINKTACLESNSGLNKRVAPVRRKHDVAVKLPVLVRLSKSRSMGVLQSSASSTTSRMVLQHSKEKRFVLVVKNPQSRESEECKLLLSLDHESKKKESSNARQKNDTNFNVG